MHTLLIFSSKLKFLIATIVSIGSCLHISKVCHRCLFDLCCRNVGSKWPPYSWTAWIENSAPASQAFYQQFQKSNQQTNRCLSVMTFAKLRPTLPSWLAACTEIGQLSESESLDDDERRATRFGLSLFPAPLALPRHLRYTIHAPSSLSFASRVQLKPEKFSVTLDLFSNCFKSKFFFYLPFTYGLKFYISPWRKSKNELSKEMDG